MSQSPCYTTALYLQEKKYENSSLYVHEKMSNVTQNMDDFWPCVMYVTQDRKFFSTIKL